MDFSKVNSVGRNDFLPKKSLSDLNVGEHFKVTSLKQVKTQFGSRIVITINAEYQVFLPTRFHAFFDQEREKFTNMETEVNNNRLFMKYLGNRKLEFFNQF